MRTNKAHYRDMEAFTEVPEICLISRHSTLSEVQRNYTKHKLYGDAIHSFDCEAAIAPGESDGAPETLKIAIKYQNTAPQAGFDCLQISLYCGARIGKKRLHANRVSNVPISELVDGRTHLLVLPDEAQPSFMAATQDTRLPSKIWIDVSLSRRNMVTRGRSQRVGKSLVALRLRVEALGNRANDDHRKDASKLTFEIPGPSSPDNEPSPTPVSKKSRIRMQKRNSVNGVKRKRLEPATTRNAMQQNLCNYPQDDDQDDEETLPPAPVTRVANERVFRAASEGDVPDPKKVKIEGNAGRKTTEQHHLAGRTPQSTAITADQNVTVTEAAEDDEEMIDMEIQKTDIEMQLLKKERYIMELQQRKKALQKKAPKEKSGN